CTNSNPSSIPEPPSSAAARDGSPDDEILKSVCTGRSSVTNRSACHSKTSTAYSGIATSVRVKRVPVATSVADARTQPAAPRSSYASSQPPDGGCECPSTSGALCASVL